MIIKNISGEEICMSFVGTNGVTLQINQEVSIEDKYAGHESLKAMIEDGIVTRTSYSVSDDRPGEDINYTPDYMSSAEFNSLASGMFRVGDDWTSVGTIQASATPFVLTGTVVGPFNTSTNNVLHFKFDGINTQKALVHLPQGQLDVDTLKNALNSNADFAKYGVADKVQIGTSGTYNITITSKAVGINSKVEILDNIISADLIIGLRDGVETVGTLTTATITINTYNPTGVTMAGLTHTVKLYTLDTPSSVVTTEFQIQRVAKGTVQGTLFTNSAILTTDENGQLEFEIAAASAITTGCYVAIDLPETFYLANIPATRLQAL